MSENLLTVNSFQSYYAAGPGHKVIVEFVNLPEFVKAGGMLHGAAECIVDFVDKNRLQLILKPAVKTTTLNIMAGSVFSYSDPMLDFARDVVDFDIESTGKDKQKDRIVELAMIKYRGDQIIDEFVVRVNPGVPIPAEVTAIHGITDEDVKNEPIFKDYAKMIHDFIKGCDLSGYNIMGFDVPMLFNEFERAGVVWDYKQHNFIDVMRAYKSVYPDNLMGAYKRLFNEEFDAAHSATADIKASRRILNALNLGKTAEEMTLLSNYDSPIMDLHGKFAFKDGVVVLNFGEHIGKPAADNKSYLKWMLTKDFTADVKAICNQIIEQK